ncbi:enterochelin esterase [Streptomyces sp. TRM66268-LWL]|uniref:Enterochelin esterase n=1 Tax=Streptomyces polyasparticus TaxID=2767826 RepID=A0ABR7SFS9_9ACTN|nr:enterochelin esterase [Streptomyces polyasparticus]MBC9713442.1 enterochelin esterase [Streptomyces polyasparticus]
MSYESPALTALRDGGPQAVREFWNRLEATGAPLVEADAEDPAYRRVTFVWRDDPGTPADDVVVLLHTVTDKDRHAGDLTPHLMRRIEGTDVWAGSYRLRADHRASYQFHVARGPREETLGTHREAWLRTLDGAVPDPLNRLPQLPGDGRRRPSSVLELPDAPAQLTGGGDDQTFETEAFGRRVYVHLPSRPGPHPVAVLLDGEVWGPRLRFGRDLDAAVAEGLLPPMVTVMVDTMGRDARVRDLSCSGQFVDWLADVLLPWTRAEFGATHDPARTVIAGQSAGGLTAAFAAFRRPERFGNALSQSGSFWWPDDTEFDADSEWLTRQYAITERRAVRFYLEVGLQEWMLLAQNRHLRNVLEAKGYEVTYREFNGGHDYACWRGGLLDGLVQLAKGW